MSEWLAPIAGLPTGTKVVWFLGTNILCFVLMFWDKLCATKGWWRINEATLLIWAFVGGGVGAKIGQRTFRHKTRKEPFRSLLNVALVCSMALVAIVFAVISML